MLFGYPVIVSCNVMATFALALTAVSVGCSLVLNRIKSTNFHHDRVQEHVICATLEQSVSHWTSSTSGNRNLTHPDELTAFWAYLNWAYFSKQSTNFVTYDVFIWIILKIFSIREVKVKWDKTMWLQMCAHPPITGSSWHFFFSSRSPKKPELTALWNCS